MQAVNVIAINLRQTGYVYEGRRARITQGSFLYESSIPDNWKSILTESGLLAERISKLADAITAAWNIIKG